MKKKALILICCAAAVTVAVILIVVNIVIPGSKYKEASSLFESGDYARAAEAFPSCDVELQYGGQPIYYYILSAE